MNKKKRIILIVSLAILLVLGVVIGYSFAYFSATVINGTPINETLVTTSALEIEFTDGPEVSLVNAIPGTSVTKTFKIENKTSLDTTYDVYMSEVVNEFVDKSDLVYTITSNDGGYNTSGEVQVPDENTKVIDAQLLRGNETHNYTLKVEFKEKFEIQDDNKDKEIKFTIRVNEEREAERYKTIVQHIIDLAPTDDTIVDDETTDHNLRYIGSNPNNYVSYNGELWRIIGAMNNVETEGGQNVRLAKIIRDESLGNYSWDSSPSEVNNGKGINEWSQADLMQELNNDYLGNVTVGTDGNWYSYYNNVKETVKPTSTMNSESQSKIESVVWKLGSPTNDNGNYVNFANNAFNAQYVYTHERISNTGKLCTSGTLCNDNVARTSSWTGRVGLFYMSDFLYATSGGNTVNRQECLNSQLWFFGIPTYSDCWNNDWLYYSSFYQWTLSPFANTSEASLVININQSGDISYIGAGTPYAVRPAIFLKSTVIITGGTGTQADPYTLG